MTEQELFDNFKKLGWSNDIQSMSIFNFLMNARKNILQNTILLDLGAGESRYKFIFEHCHYISIDFAQGDSKWDYNKLDFIGDICNLNFIKDESVHNCLNTTTLEHLNEPSKFFPEVYRVLKCNGKLFLYVPFVYSEHQIPHDYYRYTSYGLKYLCEKAGLKVISIKSTNSPLYTGSRWLSLVLAGLRGKGLFSNVMIKIIRKSVKSGIIPLFDFLEKYSTEDNFPMCWLLEAQKVGSLTSTNSIYDNKMDALNSIICCPECKNNIQYSKNSFVCKKCNKKIAFQVE